MKKPIIGITLDYEAAGGYSKFPWYAIRHNYLNTIDKLGGIPFPLLHSNKNINEIFKILDGLIITGGNFDINPNIYGEKKIINSQQTKNVRTKFELEICKKFLKSNKPIFGICGGEQLINVACGGTLIQDIKKFNFNSLEHEQQNSRDQTSHTVQLVENTIIKKIIKKNKINVNSAHHQAVGKLGDNIIASSFASDQIIESIEHVKHKWCIGVQWHPEFLITREDRILIKNFIRESNN